MNPTLRFLSYWLVLAAGVSPSRADIITWGDQTSDIEMKGKIVVGYSYDDDTDQSTWEFFSKEMTATESATAPMDGGSNLVVASDSIEESLGSAYVIGYLSAFGQTETLFDISDPDDATISNTNFLFFAGHRTGDVKSDLSAAYLAGPRVYLTSSSTFTASEESLFEGKVTYEWNGLTDFYDGEITYTLTKTSDGTSQSDIYYITDNEFDDTVTLFKDWELEADEEYMISFEFYMEYSDSVDDEEYYISLPKQDDSEIELLWGPTVNYELITVANVPEPGTGALLLLGAAAMLRRRRG